MNEEELADFVYVMGQNLMSECTLIDEYREAEKKFPKDTEFTRRQIKKHEARSDMIKKILGVLGNQ